MASTGSIQCVSPSSSRARALWEWKRRPTVSRASVLFSVASRELSLDVHITCREHLEGRMSDLLNIPWPIVHPEIRKTTIHAELLGVDWKRDGSIFRVIRRGIPTSKPVGRWFDLAEVTFLVPHREPEIDWGDSTDAYPECNEILDQAKRSELGQRLSPERLCDLFRVSRTCTILCCARPVQIERLWCDGELHSLDQKGGPARR